MGNGINLDEYCKNCNVSYNTIYDNGFVGVAIPGEGHHVSYNTISNNEIGVGIEGGGENQVFLNNFYHNSRRAIFIIDSKFDKIYMNNFFGITRILAVDFDDKVTDSWYKNYWGRPRIIPMLVLGWQMIWIYVPEYGIEFPIPYPVIRFDRNPALKPYDIP